MMAYDGWGYSMTPVKKDDFTKRIRNTAKGYDNGGILGEALKDCANRIDELEKEISRLNKVIGEMNENKS